jgi:hypothetical protein
MAKDVRPARIRHDRDAGYVAGVTPQAHRQAIRWQHASWSPTAARHEEIRALIVRMATENRCSPQKLDPVRISPDLYAWRRLALGGYSPVVMPARSRRAILAVWPSAVRC